MAEIVIPTWVIVLSFIGVSLMALSVMVLYVAAAIALLRLSRTQSTTPR